MAVHYSPLAYTAIGGGVDDSSIDVSTSTLFTLPPCSYLFAFAVVARVLSPDLDLFLPFSVIKPHFILLRLRQHGKQVLPRSGHVSIP